MGVRARFLMPTRGGAYMGKVLGLGPIAYWMLAEAAGATAIDQINSPAQDGTHTGVTLGQPGIGDDKTCPLYDGVNDRTNIYTTTFRDAFNGAEGTILIWAKVSASAVWADSTERHSIGIGANDSNRVRVLKPTTADSLLFVYQAAGTQEVVTVSGITDIDWMALALTWSATADQFKVFKDGAQVGSTQTSLGTWAGALADPNCAIGARLSDGWSPWDGYVAHCAIWDTVLSPTQIASVSKL